MGSKNVTGGSYTSSQYVRYLMLYHQLTLPSRQSALDSLALAAGSRVLDAGCGAGHMLPLFAQAVGPDGAVVGIDSSDILLSAARERVLGNVRVMLTDLLQPLPFADSSFDLIWSADVLHPSPGFDHMRVLVELARVLRPGGRLAVFHSGWLRPLLLPGHSYLEHLLGRAREYMYSMEEGAPGIHWEGNVHPERAQSWLHAVGLAECATSIHISFHRQPLLPEVREFLEQRLTMIYGKAVEEFGMRVGLTDEDLRQWGQISRPGTERYILAQDDYYCFVPAVLATGTKPR